MQLSMWTYPWDIQDNGAAAVTGELQAAGLNTVSLATSYHAGRFLQPRSLQRKVYFPEDGTIYFKPTPARWDNIAIRPRVADVVERWRRACRPCPQARRWRHARVVLDGLSA